MSQGHGVSKAWTRRAEGVSGGPNRALIWPEHLGPNRCLKTDWQTDRQRHTYIIHHTGCFPAPTCSLITTIISTITSFYWVFIMYQTYARQHSGLSKSWKSVHLTDEEMIAGRKFQTKIQPPYCIRKRNKPSCVAHECDTFSPSTAETQKVKKHLTDSLGFSNQVDLSLGPGLATSEPKNWSHLSLLQFFLL